MKNVAKIVNTMSVETPTGFRTFNLVAGDITQTRDPLLVTSSWRVFNSVGGQVINTLIENHKIDFSERTPIVNLGNGIGTFEVHMPTDSIPWRLLVVGLPGAEHCEEFSDEILQTFNQGIWTLFGSLSALELRGERYSAMSMPVLGGNRAFPPKFVASTLLGQAIDWLKASQSMRTVNAWIYDMDTVQVWIDAMDSVLHRRTVSSAANSVAQALKEEILSQIESSESLTQPPFQSSSVGISRELRCHDVSIQRLATFSRILIEQMVREIAATEKLMWSGNLWEGITELARRDKVAPWIISHFHTLRVLGNETVHEQSDVQYVPADLQDSDLVPVLACLSRILSFWQSWRGS